MTQKNWERSNESLKYRTFSTLSGQVVVSSLFIRWFYRNLKMSLIPIVRLICYFHQLFALIRVYSWQTRVFTRSDPKIIQNFHALIHFGCPENHVNCVIIVCILTYRPIPTWTFLEWADPGRLQSLTFDLFMMKSWVEKLRVLKWILYDGWRGLESRIPQVCTGELRHVVEFCSKGNPRILNEKTLEYWYL